MSFTFQQDPDTGNWKVIDDATGKVYRGFDPLGAANDAIRSLPNLLPSEIAALQAQARSIEADLRVQQQAKNQVNNNATSVGATVAASDDAGVTNPTQAPKTITPDGRINARPVAGTNADQTPTTANDAGTTGPTGPTGAQGTSGATVNTFPTDATNKADITTRTDSGFYEHDTATTAEGWPLTSNSWMHMIACTHSNDANYYSMQISASFYNNTDLFYRSTNGSGTTAWTRIWNAANDGSGSGLDADFLDGTNSTGYVQLTDATSWNNYHHPGGEYYTVVHGVANNHNNFIHEGFYHVDPTGGTNNPTNSYAYLRVHRHKDTNYGIQFHYPSGDQSYFLMRMAFDNAGTRNWTAWSSYGSLGRNNTWSGTQTFSSQISSTVATGTAPFSVASTTVVTNLNADLLDGLNSATANTASTIVARDASGNFSAGTITAALSGNATTATNLSNSGTVTLATATESNSIYITQPSYTTDQPVKLLNFDWYGNIWSLGNIRSGSTPSNGFGVYSSGTERARFTTSGLTVGGTVTGSSIIRSGGTSSQFLKADGSVDSNTYITSASVGNGTLTLGVSGTGLSGSASFTANQSGNTTFTVTSNATSANTVSTIVARDGSGNFSAGTITATLSGNATSAGSVTNSVTFNNGGSGDASGTTFNGSAARTISHNTLGASPLAGSTSLTTTGTVTTGTWSASFGAVSGANLTSLNASNLGSGTVPTARLGSGTANNTTYLRGDQTWAALPATGVTISDDTTTNATRYPVFEDATSGNATSMQVSSTKLQFNPSTGTLSATIFTSLSDLTQKKNIQKISNSTTLIKQISGVRFNWKDNDELSAGVIAQEVEEIMPEIVHTDSEGIKSVNYNGIIGLLVEAIKEQQVRIEELERKLNA